MAFPDVVTREQWLEARERLLDLEKQATRARDALNAERRRLPMVRVDKEYVLAGPDGTKTLAGLFGGSRQLIVRHVMFDPDWDAACPGCTAAINEMSEGPVVTYSLLDLTALGRQEDWEEPKDRAPRLHGADPTFRD